jgi:dihydrodipicolinate synthase/N-acetylneuraminate lyase
MDGDRHRATDHPRASESSRYPRTILATCCIPWIDDHSFDEQIFRESIRRLVTGGIPDLYIFGTAGEGHAVSDRLFKSVTRAFISETQDHGVAPMVGVISSSLATIIERIEFAAELGCDVFQISLPNWGWLPDREVVAFFDAVCGQFPNLQFIHYNVGRSGRLLRPAQYVQIASNHANLVGTKYGGGDPELIAGLLLQAPMLRHFLTESGFYTGCSIGPCGLLASLSTSNPPRARQYYEAGVAKDADLFAALHRELAWMMTELRGAVGPELLIDGTYDKIIAKVADPEFPLRLLPPWTSPSEASYVRYRNFLSANASAWLETRNARIEPVAKS